MICRRFSNVVVILAWLVQQIAMIADKSTSIAICMVVLVAAMMFATSVGRNIGRTINTQVFGTQWHERNWIRRSNRVSSNGRNCGLRYDCLHDMPKN